MTHDKDTVLNTKISAINTIQHYGKSFSFAGSFLGKETFNDSARLYKFCRIIDDIVDLSEDINASETKLLEISEALMNEDYNYSNWLSDYLDLSKKYNIPKSYSKILIDGVLGLGASRSPKGRLLGAINFINEVRTKKKVFVISFLVALPLFRDLS